WAHQLLASDPFALAGGAMSFWKKVVSFFAASTDPAEAVRILADSSRKEDERRAQIPLVEDLSDKFGEKSPESLARVTTAFTDLTRALGDREAWVRVAALKGLKALAGMWRFDVEKRPLHAALEGAVRLLRDGEPTVRENAAWAAADLSEPFEERRA